MIWYANAPIIVADTEYNNSYIGIDTEAPQGAYTIQNNGFVRGIIAPDIGASWTNLLILIMDDLVHVVEQQWQQ